MKSERKKMSWAKCITVLSSVQKDPVYMIATACANTEGKKNQCEGQYLDSPAGFPLCHPLNWKFTQEIASLTSKWTNKGQIKSPSTPVHIYVIKKGGYNSFLGETWSIKKIIREIKKKTDI